MKTKWPVKRLGEVCNSTELRDPSSAPDELFDYIDLSSIDRDTKTIQTTSRIAGRDAPSRARKEIRSGDILVSSVRPNLNSVAVVPDRLDGQIASTGFCVLRPDSTQVLSQFLFHRVRCPDFVRFLADRVTGANYPAVSDRIILNAPLPLPPLPEQRRIVAILDEAENLRTLRRQADRRTADLIPALFHDMFGDPSENPKGWPVFRFSEICDSRLGKMLDAKRQTAKHLRPYLRNANVQWDRFDLSKVEEMDFDEDDRQEFLLCNGDILICEGGEVGRTAVWRGELPECYFQKAIHRARPKGDVCVPEYVCWLMRALANGRGFVESAGSATIAHLTGVQLKRLRVPLPPLPLQKQFAAAVGEIRAMQEQQAASRRRLDDLFQSLLHRAFRGEL